MNGKNLGVFANVEEIRKPLLGRHFGNDSGNLYEGTVSDFHPALIRTFEKQSNEEQRRERSRRCCQCARRRRREILAALGAIVDIDAFMKFWAMEALVGQWDGYSSNRNNYYLYHHPVGQVQLHPWGRHDPVRRLADRRQRCGCQYGNVRILGDNAPACRLPQIRERYRTQMQALLNTVWNEPTVLGEISRMEIFIRPYSGDLSPAIQRSGRSSATGERRSTRR